VQETLEQPSGNEQELLAQNKLLLEQNGKLVEQIGLLSAQINLLQQKVQLLLKRLFGAKSEKMDKGQLELLLGSTLPEPLDDDDPPPGTTKPPRPRRKRERKPRLPENLPVEEQIIDPEAVKQDRSAYQCIGEEVTEALDVVPTRYFLRRIIRRKFRSKINRQRPPLIAPLPPRLIEGSLASAGLLTDIMLRKYEDHLPLYRQEQILRTRHGIELSRKTMSDWVRATADWLTPIYNHIREELRQSAYLQADETPVRYCQKIGGGSGKGYLWVFNDPGGGVLFEWHTGRAASCLDEMLSDFAGTLQCDGYAAYPCFVKEHPEIELAACWAHARRKVHESLAENPTLAAWLLRQIAHLYRIEAELCGKGPALRQAVRTSQSAMITTRIKKALRIKLVNQRPTSTITVAMKYTLSLWPQLVHFIENGRVQIDKNGVENAIRPVAIGRKNYLFFGHPEAGQRSAVMYTLLQCCKRQGINPQEYLHDVLSRLPMMTNQQTHALTPARWQEAKRAEKVA
jgi:transposase